MTVPAPTDTRSPQLQVVTWDDFTGIFREAHKQGEHVATVGPTGSGKSVLNLSLCQIIGSRMGTDRRPARVVVLGTKPRDDTLTSLGWPIIKKWPPAYGQEHCIVWPRKGHASMSMEHQRRIFLPLLNVIHGEGNQTVCIDEAATFERGLPHGMGLSGLMEDYWTNARSSRVSLVGGTQRPRHVTLSMWTEPSWLVIFPPEDLDDLKRVADLSGCKEMVLEVVPQLGPFECLVIRRQRQRGQTGKTLYVTKVGT